MNTPFLRYAITDRSLISSNEENTLPGALHRVERIGLIDQAIRLAFEGVDYLQLREKDLPMGDIVTLARGLLSGLRDSGTKLLINSRADIAIATGAHGVHLTSSPDELTPRQIHALYALANLPVPVVTISCHTLADVIRNRLEPVTAILFGPVFEKVLIPSSDEDKARLEGTGLDLLRQACDAAAPVPVFALGGVTPTNAPACIEFGASGVAGIRLFASSWTL